MNKKTGERNKLEKKVEAIKKTNFSLKTFKSKYDIKKSAIIYKNIKTTKFLRKTVLSTPLYSIAFKGSKKNRLSYASMENKYVCHP